MTGAPAARVLSLGAGVQSSTLLLLAVEGHLPKPDLALFADTGWEPRAVYEHLAKLEALAADAGITVRRVASGNIRTDVLDPDTAYGMPPLHVLNADGTEAMVKRQCTERYKVRPIKRAVRELLGYPHPTPVPDGVYVEQWIGFSRDEVTRIKAPEVAYQRFTYPLLDLPGAADGRPGWTRADCVRYLTTHGMGDTPKSACVGCPFHRNDEWRKLRDTDPEGWADAVAFDAAIRHGSARATANGNPLRGQAFLHRARVPLDRAPVDRVTPGEWSDRQLNVWDAVADEQGCSPFGCRDDGR